MAETRTSKQFSITIRPGDSDGVSKYESAFIKWLDNHTSHYVVAYEQKGDLSTQHFQACAIFNDDKRSDHLKTTLLGILEEVVEFTPDQRKHAVCVKKNRESNDIRLLAGGYCMKQDVSPFIKGWTLDELQPYSDEYETLREQQQLRNISREKIKDYIQEWNDELINHKDYRVRDAFDALSEREKIKYCFKIGISKGADLSKYSTPVWLNYFTTNYDVLFMGCSAQSIAKELSRSRV